MEGYMTLTPNGLLLDVGVSPENIKKKIQTNKRHILENPNDFLVSKSEFFVLCIDYRILSLLI
jgi:hypothetical protein